MTDPVSRDATAASGPQIDFTSPLADTPYGLSENAYYDLVELGEALEVIHALLERQTMPSDIRAHELRALFGLLRDRAEHVADRAVTLWPFPAPAPADPFPAFRPAGASEDAA